MALNSGELAARLLRICTNETPSSPNVVRSVSGMVRQSGTICGVALRSLLQLNEWVAKALLGVTLEPLPHVSFGHQLSGPEDVFLRSRAVETHDMT